MQISQDVSVTTDQNINGKNCDDGADHISAGGTQREVQKTQRGGQNWIPSVATVYPL